MVGIVDGTELNTFLHVIEIGAILGGGLIFLIRLGGTFEKINGTNERLESVLRAQDKQIEEIKDDLKSINRLMIDVALQNQRLDSQDSRLAALDRRYEDLRHGEGFVVRHP